MIGSYFGMRPKEIDELDDDAFDKLYAAAIWLEEREITRMAAAIGKAFGADK